MFCVFLIQPIADRVAQHLEIISKNSQFSTRRTRILLGFIIYYLVLIVNPMGRILVLGVFFEMISRCCATLSAICWTCIMSHIHIRSSIPYAYISSFFQYTLSIFLLTNKIFNTTRICMEFFSIFIEYLSIHIEHLSIY